MLPQQQKEHRKLHGRRLSLDPPKLIKTILPCLPCISIQCRSQKSFWQGLGHCQVIAWVRDCSGAGSDDKSCAKSFLENLTLSPPTTDRGKVGLHQYGVESHDVLGMCLGAPDSCFSRLLSCLNFARPMQQGVTLAKHFCQCFGCRHRHNQNAPPNPAVLGQVGLQPSFDKAKTSSRKRLRCCSVT